MHGTFTQTLRQVLASAQSEARTLQQDFVSTEHLILGLLQTPSSEAIRLLQQANIQIPQIRNAIGRDLPKGKQPPVVTGDLPLSPKAQRVISSAIVKAQTLRGNTISTRLLLLAVLEDDGTSLRAALMRHGAVIDELQQALTRPPTEIEA